MDAKRKRQGLLVAKIGAVIIGILLVLGMITYAWGLTTVDEGETYVVKEKGAVTGETFEPGWHYRTPIMQSVEAVPTRPQTYTMSGNPWEGDTDNVDSIEFMTADQQQINADVTVRYNIPAEQAPQFHSEWNNLGQAEDRLIRPVTEDTVQRAGSSMNATEANSDEGRELLADEISERLQEETGAEVSVDSVQVRDIHLDPNYREELEKIEIEQAQAEQKIIDAEADAEAEVTRAEGDAEAMEIRNEEITDNILALEQIEAYDDGTVFVIDGDSQQMILDQDTAGGDDVEEWGDDE